MPTRCISEMRHLIVVHCRLPLPVWSDVARGVVVEVPGVSGGKIVDSFGDPPPRSISRLSALASRLASTAAASVNWLRCTVV